MLEKFFLKKFLLNGEKNLSMCVIVRKTIFCSTSLLMTPGFFVLLLFFCLFVFVRFVFVVVVFFGGVFFCRYWYISFSTGPKVTTSICRVSVLISPSLMYSIRSLCFRNFSMTYLRCN